MLFVAQFIEEWKVLFKQVVDIWRFEILIANKSCVCDIEMVSYSAKDVTED